MSGVKEGWGSRSRYGYKRAREGGILVVREMFSVLNVSIPQVNFMSDLYDLTFIYCHAVMSGIYEHTRTMSKGQGE